MVGARDTSANAVVASFPACAGSNLVGAFVSNQIASGHVVTTVAITNVGITTCTLGGYPGLIGIQGNEKIALHVTAHGTYGGNLRPAILRPRSSGALIIGTGDLCAPYYGVTPAGHSYSGLILVLPKNKELFRCLALLSTPLAIWSKVNSAGEITSLSKVFSPIQLVF